MRILILLLVVAGCAHQPTTEKSKREFSWISPADKNLWVKRQLTGDSCPPGMKARFKPDDRFPENVCESTFARGTESPKRIVVFGDTGCRIKIGKKVEIQACNDGEKWPFAQVATSATAWKPDLVIHVGDYHYRDSDCPADHPECAGSVTGDRSASWIQDFLTPADPLLRAAPWIFVRGNHEICERAGHGWFHFLAPGPYKDCDNRGDAYTVSFPAKDFLVLDSAANENIQPSIDRAPQSRPKTWLLTHRPLLTLDADETSPIKAHFPKEFFKNIAAVFAGHVHTVSINRLRDGRPPEFIVGNGGSALAEPGLVAAQEKAGAEATAYHDYGFTTLEDQGNDDWRVIIHDRTGRDIIGCEWKEARWNPRALRCKTLK